jgi:hypothetical protein
MHTVILMLPGGRRVCHHFFVHDEAAPVKTPARAAMTAFGPVRMGGSRGYIACMGKEAAVTPQVERDRVIPRSHTNEARAVTCPGCMQSAEWKETMARIRERAGTPPEPAPDGDQTKG